MGWFTRKSYDPLVRVIDLAADKLEPNSHYLIVLNREQVNIRDCQTLASTLKAQDIKASIAFVEGDVRTAIRAYSIPENQTQEAPMQEPVKEVLVRGYVDPHAEDSLLQKLTEYEQTPKAITPEYIQNNEAAIASAQE